MASGSWPQSESAVSGAEAKESMARGWFATLRREAKVAARPFSLAGRIIARVIICQLVLTAALTTVRLDLEGLRAEHAMTGQHRGMLLNASLRSGADKGARSYTTAQWMVLVFRDM